ncbi:MAG TPA: RdgB/HAM1 family non-canonical purine NTP pyrophosphatase [Candidatus Acidoferrales bacterium]|nr:RdgB/HAM1 family non-canonical purine NTP pyrophosphatase [Candidatus Acidoferrales bacterium]
MEKTVRVLLATSNPGKLREYREMAANSRVQLELLPGFQEIPRFDESAPTFAENAAGKALHYSRFADELILAEDSGLVVPALGGEPGVHSARYAGPQATDSDRVKKLLTAMEGKAGKERQARFICVIALALRGNARTVVSDFVRGDIVREPHGEFGFGYDPVFLPVDSRRTFAEISQYEKNLVSHRGKAFRKALEILCDPFALK